MTELTTAELWQSAPIETDLHRKRDLAGRVEVPSYTTDRTRAPDATYWHPTTPTREALMIALQVLTNEEKPK
jgi:hypothetical protein